jgi:2'-5' RNA ligase
MHLAMGRRRVAAGIGPAPHKVGAENVTTVAKQPGPEGYGGGVLFSLVRYVPGPLGLFLNELRCRLVSSCRLQSHLTILPPRVLSTPMAELIEELQRKTAGVETFQAGLGGIEIFPTTDVVYLSITTGAERLRELHAELAQGILAYPEPFPFHPHITLAQEIAPGGAAAALEEARRAWSEWQGPQSFMVDRLWLVRNVNQNGWEDLTAYALRPSPLLQTA